jgi:flagellar basal body rod protein FlgG
MENALLVGLSRQMVLERQMDVVANNVANVNTSGYKADRSMFQEYLASGVAFPGGSAALSVTNERRSGAAMMGIRFPLSSGVDIRNINSASPGTIFLQPVTWRCQ